MEERPYPSAWQGDENGEAPPSGFFRTWMQVMTGPVDFFDTVDLTAPFSRPLLFYLVISVVSTAFASATTLAVMGDPYAEALALEGLNIPLRTWQMFTFFMSPFLALLSLVIYVGFVHLGVRIFVLDARPIGVTTRGLCYCASPSVLYIVPFLGAFVATIWSTYLAIVSVWRLHATTAGRASAAVLVPLVIGFVASVVLVVLLVMFAIAVTGMA